MARQYKSFRERIFGKILRATVRLELGDSFFPVTAASVNQAASAAFTVLLKPLMSSTLLFS